MNQQKNTRSSLFLIELMIAILFFALGSTVCIQVFVKAYTVDQDAKKLSFASLQASSAASALKYTDGTPASMKEYFPLITEENGELVVYYDKNFHSCEKKDSLFSLHINVKQKNQTVFAGIRMEEKSRTKPVYELELRYPALERPGEL